MNTKYTKQAAPVSILVPVVEDVLAIESTASEEEKLFKLRLSTVSVFNIRTESEFKEWVQYPAILEAANDLTDLLPLQSYRSNAGKELVIPRLQVAIYTVIWGLLRERTAPQIAAMLPNYTAGTPEALAMATATENLCQVAQLCGLVQTRAADGTRGERYIIHTLAQLEEAARADVTYSGVILNPKAQVIGNELIIPATYDKAGNLLTDYFSAPVKVGSTLSDWYIMPEVTPELEATLNEWHENHRRLGDVIMNDPLRGSEHIDMIIHDQQRPPYDLEQVKKYAGMTFCVLMNHDTRGRETASAAVGQFMDSEQRARLRFALCPDKELHHRDGTALCLALSSFILGWSLPHEAEAMNLTPKQADPYAACVNMLPLALQNAILAEATPDNMKLAGKDTAPKYLREVVKKAVTPISYGSGLPTATRAIVENTGLNEQLAARIAKIVRMYPPLKAYLKAVQKGTSLNSAVSYTFEFEYDGEQYTIAATLDNRYQGDIFQDGRTPVHYTHGMNNEKARTAAPANYNQHLESVLLRAMRAIAARKAEQGNPQDWLVFATHDSIGTPDRNNTAYLCRAIPTIANEWARQAQATINHALGITFPPRNTWIDENSNLYIED